jgi:hypothetical protein
MERERKIDFIRAVKQEKRRTWAFVTPVIFAHAINNYIRLLALIILNIKVKQLAMKRSHDVSVIIEFLSQLKAKV